MSYRPPSPGRLPVRASRLLAVALAGLAAAAAMLLTAGPAAAHSKLKSIDPKHKSVQATMPTQVVLTFNEPVNPRYTEVEVSGPGDAKAGTGDPDVDGPKVRQALGSVTAPGRYRVAYRTVSVDGHVISGEREFTYRPAASPTPSAAAAPAPGTAGGTGPVAGSARQDEREAGSPWVLVTLGGVGVALAAGVVVAVRRGRGEG